MQIILNYGELYEVVKRTISIVAKRSVDDKGNRLFDNITLGSREESIIHDYFRTAIVALAAELREFVTLETPATASYAITFTLYADANPDLENTIRQAVKDYAVAYALFSWFVISAPRISDKYLADANADKGFVVYQVYHRQRPSSLPDPLRHKSES